MSPPGPAVVLLSGGLDSATCLHLARERGHRLYALSFDYGQRHHHELAAARRVAAAAGVAEHRVCRLDLGWLGGSSLLGDGEVAKDRDPAAIGSDVPRTYVPARNTIFLAQALAWAEVLDARDIVIGANHLDYSGYPDCRPEYLRAFEQLARLATRAGVEGARLRIHAPLLELDKAGIVELGHQLGVDFALTHSCYDPDAEARACGRCDACQLRLRGFARAGHEDPARYQPGVARPDRS